MSKRVLHVPSSRIQLGLPKHRLETVGGQNKPIGKTFAMVNVKQIIKYGEKKQSNNNNRETTHCAEDVCVDQNSFGGPRANKEDKSEGQKK